MNDLISIIIPIFNKEKNLEKCLDSISNQTYKNIEIILINDGSSDGSEMICKKFKEIDYRIKYLYQKNSGVSVARNVGIEMATGRWIMFVDADDYIDNNTCEFAIQKAISYNADMMIWAADNIQNGKSSIVTLSEKDEVIWANKEINELKTLLISGNEKNLFYNYVLAGPCCKLIRRGTVSDARFPIDIDFCEDDCFIAQVLDNANIVVYVNVPCYKRVVLKNSLSHKYDDKMAYRVMLYVKWMLDYWDDMSEKNRNLFVSRNMASLYLYYLQSLNLKFNEKKRIVENASEIIDINPKFDINTLMRLPVNKRIAVISWKFRNEKLFILCKTIYSYINGIKPIHRE